MVCKHSTNNLISSTACIKGNIENHASVQFEGIILITRKQGFMIFLLSQ